MQSDNMDRSDAELVAGARQGDLDAFAQLVERYRARALRLAYGIAGDDAEDAVQDAFVKAFRSLSTFRADAALKPWLFTIVANEARNRRRTTSRRARLELRVRGAPSETEGSDEAVIRREERQHLLDAVATLPEHAREVVALRYFAGLSEQETAEVLAVPRGTAKSRLSRALDALRVALADEVTS